MAQTILRVPPRSVFATVVLSAMVDPLSKERTDWPTLVDLTKRIVELREKHNLDTSNISIRADKGGWISDDLSSFVNRFVLFGLARQNPVRLSRQAQERCVEVIRKDRQLQRSSVDELLELLKLTSFVGEFSSTMPAVAPPGS